MLELRKPARPIPISFVRTDRPRCLPPLLEPPIDPLVRRSRLATSPAGGDALSCHRFDPINNDVPTVGRINPLRRSGYLLAQPRCVVEGASVERRAVEVDAG